MRIYRICVPTNDSSDHYEGTVTAAHKWAKNNIGKPLWTSVVIEERELETDKASIVAALNGAPCFKGSESTKVWDLTPRGALEEVKD